MQKWTWARSPEFITKLQEAPEPPVMVPAIPYPEQEGTYDGNRYYTTATSQSIIDTLLAEYLSFLEQSNDMVLAGRRNNDIQNLALSITKDKETTYEQARAIHTWVYKNIGPKYSRIPQITPPWDLIKPGAVGDCKSFAVLVASLLGLIEVPCWLKLIKIGGTSELHIYSMANLTWASVDGVGSYFGLEVKPISGYILYEIDTTATWPPRVLPSGAELMVPSNFSKMLPIIGIGVGIFGIVGLLLALRKT